MPRAAYIYLGASNGSVTQHLHFTSENRPIRITAQELAPLAPGQAIGRKPAIVLLHGSGGSVDLWGTQLSSVLETAGVHLYAPHYFDRTGTKRADLAMLSDGVHVPQWLTTIDDALRFVAARPAVDPGRIVLAGISLGAFLSMAHAARLSSASDDASTRIRAIVEVSGGLVPPFEGLATHHLPPTLLLHGDADTIVPVSFAHALDRKLTELGVLHRTEILLGEGHWFSPSAWPRLLMAVSAFLQPLLI